MNFKATSRWSCAIKEKARSGGRLLYQTFLCYIILVSVCLADENYSEWQLAYFGTLDVDMSADSDSDGVNNLLEYVLSSDPTVPDSPFEDADGDGLADSWEMARYGQLSYVPNDDPESDGTTISSEYEAFTEYLYNNALLYITGAVQDGHYRAIGIHSQGETIVPSGAMVTLSYGNSVKLLPGFRVENGGNFVVKPKGIAELALGGLSSPFNVTVQNGELSLLVNWAQVPEVEVVGYNLYRDGKTINSNLITETTYTDTNVVHNSTYTYQLSAVDIDEKESGLSTPVTFTADFFSPLIVSTYPGMGDVIHTNGNQLVVQIVYSDEGTGISSVVLTDENGIDITNQANVEDNYLELVLHPESHSYTFTVIVEDGSGNVTTQQLVFDVNNEIIRTEANWKGGLYSEPISVNLRCENCTAEAIIYYSLDGYPPAVDSPNTQSGPSPINGILIDQNKSLQFFAIDHYYQEETRNELYVFEDNLIDTLGLSVDLAFEPVRALLNWQAVSSTIQGYKIYRCDNLVECTILGQSRIGGYPPPDKFSLTEQPITIVPFTDSDLTIGARYQYGIASIDNGGKVGRLSELVPLTVEIETDDTPSLTEAIDRSIAWLKGRQNPSGSWGESAELEVLATSQVLNVFSELALSDISTVQISQSDASMIQGIFHLRGSNADNNDFLARKIISLARFGQNVDQELCNLVSKGNFSGASIYGWGLSPLFTSDALDTSLGILAVNQARQPVSADRSHNLLSLQTSVCSNEGAGHYSWVPKKDTSVFVSALAYHAMKARGVSPLPDYTWLYDLQQLDGEGAGSFNNDLVDTAAVLIWLSPGSDEKNAAVSYLLSKQETNGSWQNNDYLTGLCLEALVRSIDQ